MKLTGKAKEEFEAWFRTSNVISLNLLHMMNIGPYDRLDLFYKMDKSMQYGVYMGFIDSLGQEKNYVATFISELEYGLYHSESLNGAIKEALDFFFERYNEDKNK